MRRACIALSLLLVAVRVATAAPSCSVKTARPVGVRLDANKNVTATLIEVNFTCDVKSAPPRTIRFINISDGFAVQGAVLGIEDTPEGVLASHALIDVPTSIDAEKSYVLEFPDLANKDKQ